MPNTSKIRIISMDFTPECGDCPTSLNEVKFFLRDLATPLQNQLQEVDPCGLSQFGSGKPVLGQQARTNDPLLITDAATGQLCWQLMVDLATEGTTTAVCHPVVSFPHQDCSPILKYKVKFES